MKVQMLVRMKVQMLVQMKVQLKAQLLKVQEKEQYWELHLGMMMGSQKVELMEAQTG